MKISEDDFLDCVESLLEIMFEAGAEKARELGEPVDGIEVLLDRLEEEGIEVPRHMACSACEDRAHWIIDENGDLLLPDDGEEETETQ